jgi:HAD superfamily hydrolase (TIGR01509 family)
MERGWSPVTRLAGIRAITLDFGNTLVPVGRAALRSVVERTAADATRQLDLGDTPSFLAAWDEERDRQFREEVPAFREIDLPSRAIRILARLRGMPPPPPEGRWADGAAASLSAPAEVEAVVDAYSRAFVAGIPAPPGSRAVLAELHGRGFRVAILSNWPLAATIDRFADEAGWTPLLSGIYVSQRIGVIKPHPAIFSFAERGLGIAPAAILHVGDDWAADVVGAVEAGWRAAYLRGQQGDTPLPTSARDGRVLADLELDRLVDLPDHLGDPSP